MGHSGQSTDRGLGRTGRHSPGYPPRLTRRTYRPTSPVGSNCTATPITGLTIPERSPGAVMRDDWARVRGTPGGAPLAHHGTFDPVRCRRLDTSSDLPRPLPYVTSALPHRTPRKASRSVALSSRSPNDRAAVWVTLLFGFTSLTVAHGPTPGLEAACADARAPESRGHPTPDPACR